MSEVTMITVPVRLDYTYTPGDAASRFLRNMAGGRIVGQRCPSCSKVYAPTRGSCPSCGVATGEDVELAHTGTVETFCIVNIPFAGQHVECPYVSATIRLDGADVGFYALMQEVDPSDVHIGMRVEAVWKPREEWTTSMENIAYFRPADA